jgi:probable HAF family extracellular repeat protein
MSVVTMLTGPSGSTKSIAYGINDAGTVAGFAFLVGSIGDGHAILWQNGSITDLGALPGNAVSMGVQINGSGQVVGYSAPSASNADEATLWQNGTLTDLRPLAGTTNSVARGVNDAGQVVGNSFTPGGTTHAVVWQNSNITELGMLPGGTSASAGAISSTGEVVGSATTSSGATHAVIWMNGNISDLGTLAGGTSAYASAVNSTGEVVGSATTSNGNTHAVSWVNGASADLGVLAGDITSQAYGVNSAGQIVGYSSSMSLNGSSATLDHAVLWQNGTMIDLNSLLPANSGWVLNRAYGINDYGQIVGTAFVGSGKIDAFVIVPSSLSGTYNNFTPGNIIDLPYVPFNPLATAFTYGGTTLSAVEGPASLSAATVTGTGIAGLSSGNFYVEPDGHGGTAIGVSAAPFTVVDTSTNTTTISVGDANSGTLTYLQRQYIATGSDHVNITAAIPNVFLHGGTGGMNALAASAGQNVLDGGPGSNFLVGVAVTAANPVGQDTFFVDGRGTAPVWSTVVNFHQGDAATIWGVDSTTSLRYEANAGAAGYAGFTIHADTQHNGGYSSSITLAGVTQGQVVETLGVVGGTPYMYVSWAS